MASAAKTPYLHYTPIVYYMNNILATRQPRAIQDYIKIPISDEVLFGKLQKGGQVVVSVENGELKFNFKDRIKNK